MIRKVAIALACLAATTAVAAETVVQMNLVDEKGIGADVVSMVSTELFDALLKHLDARCHC